MLQHLRALKRMLWTALFMLLALPAAWAGQFKYPSMYVFGDSLSDTGNDFVATRAQNLVPAIPPSVSPHATYWNGRFTNGPVAVEYLWRLMASRIHAEVQPSLSAPAPRNNSNGAVSYAFGGSGTAASTDTPMGFAVPGLLGQVNMFASALNGKRAPKALYVVWSGSNDYLQGLVDGPHTSVGNVVQALRTLYAAGARDFLVPNLADIGLTPMARSQGLGQHMTAVSKQHNALLKSAITALGREMRDARFVTVDVYKLGEVMLSTGLISANVPVLEVLAPGSGAAGCLVTGPANCIDVPLPPFLPPFLFWDLMHPTTQVHAAIGTAMFTALLTQR